YGIILFQEQIIEISKVFANFNAIEADLFRYAISKKDRKQFELAKANFFEKAQSMGHSKELIHKTFNYIEHFANYGFNKAHATAYAILSYRLAYLKAHFSTQFYIAIIKNALQSNDTLVKYINEAKTQNIKILGPNIYYSKNTIYHNEKVIYLSYNIIKSIGSTISNKLSEIDFKKHKNIYDVFILLKKNNISDKIIETLVMGNVFYSLNNMTTILLNFSSLIRYAKLVVTSNFNEEIIQTKPTLEQLEPNYEKEQEYEFKTLGSNFNCFLTKKYEKKIKLANLKENFDNDLIIYVEKIVFLNNREMVILNISDSSMMIEIFAFDKILEKAKKIKVGLAKVVIYKRNNKFILKDINEFKK
ncbi:MAG: hypothetical protein E7Y34_01855, partial [Mycoplasma sp.]|nr:hypothetical protein [Mycoplasma sp.]